MDTRLTYFVMQVETVGVNETMPPVPSASVNGYQPSPNGSAAEEELV